MADVTTLLREIRVGTRGASDRLLSLVYDELNRLAANQVANEQLERTLSASALVHEAYLRLVGDDGQLVFENRRHFFGAAAKAMRRILVDAARHRGRAKRGGDLRRAELHDVPELEADSQLLALDEALIHLATHDSLAAEVVELHHFAGLAHDQVAELLGLTTYQARQKWTFARAWLRDAVI
jgi:RNA polymerase sigma factor (TIGR02999 family)